MVDEATGGSSLIPRPTHDGDLGHEAETPPSSSQVLRNYTKTRHELTAFSAGAEALFNRRLFPGLTDREAFDILIRGRKLDPADFAHMLEPGNAATQTLGDVLPELTAYLNKQNVDRAVDGIWKAQDVDNITKIALQWQLETSQQYTDPEYMEERAGIVAEELRKLDSLLRDPKPGDEIFITYVDPLHSSVSFSGLTTADGKGLDFTDSSDPNNPFRDLVFGGKAASIGKDRYDQVETTMQTPRLVIPFFAIGSLRPIDSPDNPPNDLHRAITNNSFFAYRDPRYGYEPDPERNFPAIVTGEEIPLLVHKGDSLVRETYEKLKELKDNGSPGQPEQITPGQ